MSVSFQATTESSWLSRIKRLRASSKRPVLIRSETMMGFEVAPVAPRARFFLMRSGSIESSHSLVPLAIKDFRGLMGYLRCGSWLPFAFYSMRLLCHGHKTHAHRPRHLHGHSGFSELTRFRVDLEHDQAVAILIGHDQVF